MDNFINKQSIEDIKDKPIADMTDREIAEEYGGYIFHSASFCKYSMDIAAWRFDVPTADDLTMRQKVELLRYIHQPDVYARYEAHYDEEIQEQLNSDHPLAKRITALYDRMHDRLGI